ncbi:MAG: DUF4349 domain-containing protein [Lachnospiraceae bacterium]|nr:DUF4349 domain-containing protein [Lachnospiraceae bacterium]
MKKKIYLLLIVLITSIVLVACGGSASDNASLQYKATDYAYSSGSINNMAYDDYDVGGYDAPMAVAESQSSTIEPMPMPEVEPINNETNDLSNRKMIKNANLSVETEEFDQLLIGIEERVKSAGGYIENFNTSNNSRFYGIPENRNSYMTIRIPARNYDYFMREVALMSNVLNRYESIEDVTFAYVDLESRKKVLLTQHERLLDLLSRSESIEDIIILEQRLSQVVYEIERMESQLRTYDNLIDYSTIWLNISEVKQLTPVHEQSAWEKIRTGFTGNLKRIGEWFVNFFISFVITIPYLVVIAVMILFGLLITKVSILIVKKKTAKKHIDKEEENS